MIDLQNALSNYTHWTTPHTGVQLEFIERFQLLLGEEVPCGQHQCTLSMDEMKLKSGTCLQQEHWCSLGLCRSRQLCDMEQAVEVEI